MFQKLDDVEKRYEELTIKISDPEVIAKTNEWQKLMKEHSDMTPIVEKYKEYKKIELNYKEAKEMLESETDKEMKDLAEEYGYAREVKEYKQTPEAYKGHVGDISTVIRIALTGRANTPDMYEIMQVLGKESIETRLRKAIKE